MIYADHNATAPMDPEVWAEMQPYFVDRFHNPSSPYTPARATALALDEARARVATLIDADPESIAFTSGGTESNAWAVQLAQKWHPERRHWICSAVEHASMLESLSALEAEGHRVTRIPLDRDGHLDLAAFERALTPDTALVSIMTANNETGILHPVRALAQMARARGIPVHTDAVQSAGRVPISFRELGVDFMSICAHKMHGPKGVGALVMRADAPCAPLLRGGGQERGRRAGTENVPAIVGFGAAAERARAGAMPDAPRTVLERAALARISGITLVGARAERLPNTSMFLIEGVHTDVLLAALDMAGVCASSGSACASGSSERSHVLRAMGLPLREPAAALRISWGRFSTESEANELVDILDRVVLEVRSRARGAS